MAAKELWGVVDCHQLTEMLKKGMDKVLLIDSRSFLEYNTCHIGEAVNVCCSKLVKRRLQQDKISVRDLLAQTCNAEMIAASELIVYDQCTTDSAKLSMDCFLMVLLHKLVIVFDRVSLLTGGFLEFQACHPSLCESKMMTSSGNHKVPTMTSMSQPCMPVTNLGPTKILPFLYLGSQQDALSQETMKKNGITYMLNVSTSCPRPPFIQEGHFLRIPVNDNYSDKLLPYFQDAFQFLDKVREANGCVLVHCLAGISRSPTLAIAYIMTVLGLNTEEAYKYVKDKRPTISPNFNFLGQLTEYESQMKQKKTLCTSGSTNIASQKKKCIEELRSPSSPCVATPRLFSLALKQRQPITVATVQSPTTALSKLSFTAPSPVTEELPTPSKDEPPSPFASCLHQFSAATTSLGEVCFTPCLSKEDPLRLSRGRKGSCGSGTKRPFSAGMSEDELHSFDRSSSDCGQPLGCHKIPSSTCQEQITMRSPETKAKRTPVRPNSIAFSSYPLFDLSSDSDALPGRVRSTSRERGRSAPRSASPVHQAEKENSSITGSCSHQVELRLQSSNVDSTINSQSFEQARKSRSMEDIIASPEDTYDILGGAVRPSGNTGPGSTVWNRSVHVADGFSQPLGLDNVHCWYRRAPEFHQSNSSISSNSSRNSHHGSMEVIQVS